MAKTPIVQLFRKSVLGQFALVFVPSALLVAAVVIGMFFWEADEELKALELEERRLTELHESNIKNAFQELLSDLMTLASHAHFFSILDDVTAHDRQILSLEFLAFIKYKDRYDQLRYLDETGREVIRIDFNGGNPQVVAEEKLQDKAGRYYFAETMALEQGGIFVSPFDLNVEHGEIERPLKPIIRVAIPVFDSKGERKGILILNYLGSMLFERIQTTVSFMDSRASIMLLNKDGFWLRGLKAEDEWGFMLDQPQNRMERDFPDEWQRIQAEGTGLFLSEKGLFSFVTVFPLTALMNQVAAEKISLNRDSDWNRYYWKLVAFVPTDELRWETQQEIRQLAPFVMMILLLLAGVSVAVAKANVRRAEVEDKIEFWALHDPLTELPNRIYLNEQLQHLVAEYERYQKSFALLFIDLDGFKGINDTHGHSVGDVVLQEVAKRIGRVVRKVDTASRVGGDEFLIALGDIKQVKNAEKVAHKIESDLKRPITVRPGLEVEIGASIGISVFPDDGQDVDWLFKAADKRMYEVKEGKRKPQPG